MKLGILVNTDRHLGDIVGIARAAISKGHEVVIFAMDSGTSLLESPEFSELCKEEDISMSFCDHSAKHVGANTEGLSSDIVCGSQYNNAVMIHDTDRLIVL